jgi:hypothetical protein
MSIETLQGQIKSIKNGMTMKQLKNDDIKSYYKVQSLTKKLSILKAEANGQFITKEHLSEYKSLIIWIMKNKTNFRGYLNLKEAMTTLLTDITLNNIVFVSKRGIKGIIVDLSIKHGLDNSYDNLISANGIDICRDNTYNNELLNKFEQFNINAKL